VVARRARAAVATGAGLVLLDGRDWAHRLSRAGYRVRSYVAQRTTGGAVRLVPLPLPDRSQDEWSPPSARWRLRQRLVSAVRRCSGRRYVTVAHRGPVTPAAVAAAVGEADRATLLCGGVATRRRSTFLVPGAARSTAPAAVKVAVGSGLDRGLREQQVLQRLEALGDLGQAAPRPLGAGTLGALCWSAESAQAGRPLPDALRHSDAAQVRSVLEDLARWFTGLGVATRTDDNGWDARDSTLPLRGEYQQLAALRRDLAGVPGVLVHGDVGTGGNVLIGPAGFGVIDWETATEPELPLTDLLPLLGLALAGRRAADDRVDYLLRLCAGLEADSGWVLALVRTYCREVRLPLEQAGRLAALAWGYQASMRLVHAELVTAAGETPDAWTSPAEEVARSWSSHPGLGWSWPALTTGSRP
jgi:hypothetical protein